MQLKEINGALFVSGSGTDADSVMAAFIDGRLPPQLKKLWLISTKPGAGGLDKADKRGIEHLVIAREGKRDDEAMQQEFEQAVTTWVLQHNIHVIFLLGCIHKIPMIPGVVIYNIHPALPFEHGGNGMYGLDVHLHVLGSIVDLIQRGRKRLGDAFVTVPTVHLAIREYDSGEALLQEEVPVPSEIIEQAMSGANMLRKGIRTAVKSKGADGMNLIINGQTALNEAASALQQVVLPVEHEILPKAFTLACERLLVNAN
ncbi:MAG: formyltransferase family protein [Patescibacteria group bacterium]